MVLYAPGFYCSSFYQLPRASCTDFAVTIVCQLSVTGGDGLIKLEHLQRKMHKLVYENYTTMPELSHPTKQ